MNTKKILIISTSTIYGSCYLEYILPSVNIFFNSVKELFFIPYAMPNGISYDDYTQKAQEKFATIGIHIKGLHEFENPKQAIREAQGFFTGGGNTFLLLKTLYDLDIVQDLREVILSGVPYMGTSAGANIVGKTINTTNDMPIVYPPSFDALNLVNFNINPHYLDKPLSEKHKGETRDQRIFEFNQVSNIPVVGIKEGSWLEVENDKIVLYGGEYSSKIFYPNGKTKEITTGTDISFLN